MDDAEIKRKRLQVLHFLEQLAANLAAGDKKAEKTARNILAKIALSGSQEILAQVFRGIVLSRDEEQEDWDTLFD